MSLPGAVVEKCGTGVRRHDRRGGPDEMEGSSAAAIFEGSSLMSTTSPGFRREGARWFAIRRFTFSPKRIFSNNSAYAGRSSRLFAALYPTSDDCPIALTCFDGVWGDSTVCLDMRLCSTVTHEMRDCSSAVLN
jgi:hypothetical protein